MIKISFLVSCNNYIEHWIFPDLHLHELVQLLHTVSTSFAQKVHTHTYISFVQNLQVSFAHITSSDSSFSTRVEYCCTFRNIGMPK